MGDNYPAPSPGAEPFAVAPPHARGTWRDIWEPGAGKKLEVRIVGRRTYGLFQHWVFPDGPGTKGVPRPCIAQWSACPCCAAHMSSQWTAYLAAQLVTGGPVGIVRLTRNAVLTCPDLVPGSGAALRGKGLLLERPGKKDNGPVTATVFTPDRPQVTVPAEPDLIAWIFHLYGLDDPRKRQ